MGRVGTTGRGGPARAGAERLHGGAPSPAASSSDRRAVQSAAPVSLETGTDVGNGRPTVSHDGLMVRRRAVIAVHPAAGAELGRAARTARADRGCRRHRPVRHPPERARTGDPGAPRAGTDPGASARKHQRRRGKAGRARLRPGGQLPRRGACPCRLSPGPRPPVQRRCRRSGSPGGFHRRGRHSLGRARATTALTWTAEP